MGQGDRENITRVVGRLASRFFGFEISSLFCVLRNDNIAYSRLQA